MEKLKILYYSNALIAQHGGRLHSEAFVKEAAKNELVQKIETYPNLIVPKSLSIGNNKVFRQKIKKNSFLQMFFFYRRNRNSSKAILNKLREYGGLIDILHIRLDSNFLIIPKIKREFPKLIITTEVNASPFDENFSNIAFRKYYSKIERKMLKKADANFFVSEFLKNRVMKQPMKNRDFVVHNGVDLDLFQPKSNMLSKGELIFGYVGTIDYHKNLKTLIDAFLSIIKGPNINVRLLIVGDGPMMNDLVKYIKEKELGKYIELVGWVPHKKISHYLNQMDVAIHHSANPYMSPLKIFEYMAVGLPVIGPDIPAIREIFQNGQEILMVKNTKDDLVMKMKYVINNRTEMEKIAKSGYQKVRNNYGWEHNAHRILTVMQDKKTQLGL